MMFSGMFQEQMWETRPRCARCEAGRASQSLSFYCGYELCRILGHPDKLCMCLRHERETAAFVQQSPDRPTQRAQTSQNKTQRAQPETRAAEHTAVNFR